MPATTRPQASEKQRKKRTASSTKAQQKQSTFVFDCIRKTRAKNEMFKKKCDGQRLTIDNKALVSEVWMCLRATISVAWKSV